MAIFDPYYPELGCGAEIDDDRVKEWADYGTRQCAAWLAKRLRFLEWCTSQGIDDHE